MTERAVYASGAAALLLALCLHLFLLQRGFYSIGWDESGRTLDAYAWATRGLVLEQAWLPFYRICVGLALRLHPDLILTPRIISLLFGLGSIVATAWLAHELFCSQKTTLLTLALATLFPPRVALSLAPLSDIMFTLVILATAALLVRWLHTNGRRSLFWCAVVGALATTIRHEGWIFAAAFFCVVAGRYLLASSRMKWTDLLLFGAALFAFPAWWSVAGYVATNPITLIVNDVPRHSHWQVLRKNPLVEFVVTNGRSLNLIGAVFIFQLARRSASPYRAIIAAFFGPLAVASVILLLAYGAQSGPSWRMIGVWSMLCLPFTARLLTSGLNPSAWRACTSTVVVARASLPASGVQRPCRGGGQGHPPHYGASSARRTTRNALAACATVLVLAAFVYDVFRLERDSFWAFPESDRRAGQYLNDLIRAEPEAQILIESSSFVFLNLQVASQHPQAFVRNSVPERESGPILPPGGPVRDALDGQGIDILVFRTDAYKRLLDHSPAVARLAQFGAWSIYRLTN